MCMWFEFNPAVNFCHFSTLLTSSFFAGATSTSPKFGLYLVLSCHGSNWSCQMVASSLIRVFNVSVRFFWPQQYCTVKLQNYYSHFLSGGRADFFIFTVYQTKLTLEDSDCTIIELHDKTNKMDCVPSEDSDQPGHPPSLIRVFAVPMKKPWVLSFPFSEQQKFLSDWVDAQAHLSLH